MYTYFEILNGANKGNVYRLQPNVSLGSSNQCNIQLIDSEAPPLHSKVMLDHKDRLVLICTNAVYEILINDKSVKKTVLYDERVLQISKTQLRVRIISTPIIGAIDPFILKQIDPQNTSAVAASEVIELSERTRSAILESPKNKLIHGLKEILDSFAAPFQHPPAFKLFKQPVLLKIETGPQADDEFLVTWGPREFGPQSLEFQLEFPPFPAVLFTLFPNDEGDVYFSTAHPSFASLLSLSGQTTSAGAITSGSKIIAGNSTILVEFISQLRGVHG